MAFNPEAHQEIVNQRTQMLCNNTDDDKQNHGNDNEGFEDVIEKKV